MTFQNQNMYTELSPKEDSKKRLFIEKIKRSKIFRSRRALIFAVGFGVIGILMLVISNASPPNKQLAASPAPLEADEILIKIKSKHLTNIKAQNPDQPASSLGVAPIDKVLNDFPGTSVKPVFRKAKKDSALAGWYQVVLPAKPGQQQLRKIPSTNPHAQPGELDTVEQKVPKYSIRDLQKAFKKTGELDAVEENHRVQLLAAPNDPYYHSSNTWGQGYADLWGLKKINSETGWNIATDASGVVVADIDTGVDSSHPEMAGSMWVNTREIKDNAVDDDGNGYVDDYRGWDWVNNDNNPMDDQGHGTHTAGTIGARGNNGQGITGVAWNATIMPLKFLGSNGSGTMSSGAAAIVYAANMGAKVTSNSWGCVCSSFIVEDALAYARSKNVINVVAAGNDRVDVLNQPTSPADSDKVITVGAISNGDSKAPFSNFGMKNDILAPGEDILSLKAANQNVCYPEEIVGTNYCRLSGTSMATPHVAGLAALTVKVNPSTSSEQFRQLVRSNATVLSLVQYPDDYYSYGRLNVGNTLTAAKTAPLPPNVYLTSPSSRTNLTGQTRVDVTGVASGPNFASYTVEIGEGHNPTVWRKLASSTIPVNTNSKLASIYPVTLNDGKHTVRLRVKTTDNKNYEFKVFNLNVKYFNLSVSTPQSAVSAGMQDVVGTVSATNGKTIESYAIEYGFDWNPSSFQSQGVSLVNNGFQTVTNGLLGRFDGSLWNDKQKYQLRLTAYATDGTKATLLTSLMVDKALVNGWPKAGKVWPCTHQQSTCHASPLVVNLDNDPDLEIVFVGNSPSQLTAYERNGSVVAGWPFTATQDSYEFFNQPPIAADVNGDGKPEIIIVSSVNGIPGGYLYILQANGKPLTGWSPKSFGSRWYENWGTDPTPAVADINRDGKPEIIQWEEDSNSSGPLKLHAYTPTGSEISGFPKLVTRPSTQPYYSYSTPPTVADLNKDGNFEIITHSGHRVYAFDNNGNALSGWPKDLNPGDEITAHAVADIYGNGQLVVVARKGRNVLHAWNLSGTLQSGWPQTGDSFHVWDISAEKNSLAVFDADNDGKEEVVQPGRQTNSLHGSAGKRSITLNDNANVLSTVTPVPVDLTSPSGSSPSQPVIIREQCGYQSVSISQKLYDQTGALNWTSSDHFGGLIGDFGLSCFFGQPLIGDLNNNGQVELIGVTAPNRPPSPYSIFMWEIPSGKTYPTDNWLMARHDAQHTQRWKRGQQNFSWTKLGSQWISCFTPGATNPPGPYDGCFNTPTNATYAFRNVNIKYKNDGSGENAIKNGPAAITVNYRQKFASIPPGYAKYDVNLIVGTDDGKWTYLTTLQMPAGALDAPQTYKLPITLPDSKVHTIELQWVNDSAYSGGDANLQIDSVKISRP